MYLLFDETTGELILEDSHYQSIFLSMVPHNFSDAGDLEIDIHYHPYQPYEGPIIHSARSIAKDFSSKLNKALYDKALDDLDQAYTLQQALKDANEAFTKEFNEFNILTNEDEKQ